MQPVIAGDDQLAGRRKARSAAAGTEELVQRSGREEHGQRREKEYGHNDPEVRLKADAPY